MSYDWLHQYDGSIKIRHIMGLKYVVANTRPSGHWGLKSDI